MPVYQFSHPEHPILIEVTLSMKEPHVYVDGEGVEWRRVWSAPNTCVGMNHDPFSSNHFLEKSRSTTSDTYGDLLDRAAEDSNKRADKNSGIDPLRKKYFKSYSKRRKGKKHKDDPSRQGP